MTEPVRPLRILLIEDNEDHAKIFRWALQQSAQPNQLTIFKNGEDALSFLKGHSIKADVAPHLVFLDLNLPRVDGREILQRIKSDELTNSYPVIVLSSSEREEDVLMAYKLGASSFISKAVLLDDLGPILESIQNYWVRIARLPGRK